MEYITAVYICTLFLLSISQHTFLPLLIVELLTVVFRLKISVFKWLLLLKLEFEYLAVEKSSFLIWLNINKQVICRNFNDFFALTS